MTNYCKSCIYHHNAGHPATSNKAYRYNDWCCKTGRPAKSSVGECKLKSFKCVKQD